VPGRALKMIEVKEERTKYLDGIRGVAVILVVSFHFSASLLPGGFVGVDVFFVLSGFLITRNVQTLLREGRFCV
jgi:peptidoglycan/LPS O-acetylase OafA/YrhL